jgi:hypothetical protein
VWGGALLWGGVRACPAARAAGYIAPETGWVGGNRVRRLGAELRSRAWFGSAGGRGFGATTLFSRARWVKVDTVAVSERRNKARITMTQFNRRARILRNYFK